MSNAFPINDDDSTPFKMGRRNIGALQNNIVNDKNLTAKVLALGLVARNMGKAKAQTAEELQSQPN